MIRIDFVRDALPAGFELLRHAADDEAFGMLGTLAAEWTSGNRFDQPGEALAAAYDGSLLIGMGAMTLDPTLPGALRMQRFYVARPYRRRGVGRLLAAALLERAEVGSRKVTLNAPLAEAARFWESLGFIRDAQADRTHVRAGDYAHA